MSEPTTDTPVLHLDRAIVAAALASDTPCWVYTPRIGWLRIAFYDRGANAFPPNVAAVEDERGTVQITFAEPSPARVSQIENGRLLQSLAPATTAGV